MCDLICDVISYCVEAAINLHLTDGLGLEFTFATAS